MQLPNNYVGSFVEFAAILVTHQPLKIVPYERIVFPLKSFFFDNFINRRTEFGVIKKNDVHELRH